MKPVKVSSNSSTLQTSRSLGIDEENSLKSAEAYISANGLNAKQESELARSLVEITAALRNGQAEQMGWSEELAFAAIDDIINRLPEEEPLPISSKRGLTVGNSNAGAHWSRETSAEMKSLPSHLPQLEKELQGILTEQQQQLAKKLALPAPRPEEAELTWGPRLSRALDAIQIPYLGSLKSIIWRCLPAALKMELADLDSVQDGVNWGIGYSPSKRYIGKIIEASENFLAIPPVVKTFAYNAEKEQKVEISAYLRQLGRLDLEAKLWKIRTLPTSTSDICEARCEFAVSSSSTTYPLAPQFCLKNAHYLDRFGRKLDEPVHTATNQFGGFHLLQVPAAAKRLKVEVEVNPDFAAVVELGNELKGMLPISSKCVPPDSHFAAQLNRMTLSPEARLTVWLHHFRAQKYMYVNSASLGKIYRSAGVNALPLLQGLRMGLCDSITCLQSEQLNQLTGVTALVSQVLSADSKNGFQVSPGHVVNQVLTASSGRMVDFTSMMIKAESKDLSAFSQNCEKLSPNDATQFGRLLRSALLKVPANYFKHFHTPNFNGNRLAEAIRQYAARCYLVEVVAPQLETFDSQSANPVGLIDILTQINDLGVLEDEQSLKVTLPHLKNIPSLRPFADALRNVLVDEAEKALSDQDNWGAVDVLDWINSQLSAEPIPNTSVRYRSNYLHQPELALTLEDLNAMLIHLNGAKELDRDQILSLIERYATALANHEQPVLTPPAFQSCSKLALIAIAGDAHEHLSYLYLAVLQNLTRSDEFDITEFTNARTFSLNVFPFMVLDLEQTALAFCKYLPRMDVAKCAQMHRHLTTGTTARFDLTLADKIAEVFPKAVQELLQQGGRPDDCLRLLEAVLDFAFKDDEIKTPISCPDVYAAIFNGAVTLPSSPGPAQRMIYLLSRTPEIQKLIERLSILKALPTSFTPEQKNEMLPEGIALTLLMTGMNFRYSMAEPGYFTCEIPFYEQTCRIPIQLFNFHSIFNSHCLTVLQHIATPENDDYCGALATSLDNVDGAIFDFLESYGSRFIQFVYAHEDRTKQGWVALETGETTQDSSNNTPAYLGLKSSILLSVLQRSGVPKSELLQNLLSYVGNERDVECKSKSERMAVLLLSSLKEEGSWIRDTLTLYFGNDSIVLHKLLATPSSSPANELETLTLTTNPQVANGIKKAQATLISELPPKEVQYWSDLIDECWQQATLFNKYSRTYGSHAIGSSLTSNLSLYKHSAATGDFDKHSPYTSGDDIRQVDWKIFSRSDRLVLKNYVDDGVKNVHFVVDLHHLAVNVHTLQEAIKLGDKALEQHCLSQVMQLFSKIQSLDSLQNRRLHADIRLASANGVQQLELSRSNYARLRYILAEHFALTDAFAFWGDFTSPKLFAEGADVSRVSKGSILNIISSPEAIENSRAGIELFRRRGAKIIINGRSA